MVSSSLWEAILNKLSFGDVKVGVDVDDPGSRLLVRNKCWSLQVAMKKSSLGESVDEL